MIALAVFLEAAPPILAQAKKEAGAADPSLLALDRIFNSRDFFPENPPALRWRSKGSSYVTLEGTAAGQQLVAHDPASGRSDVLVPDHWLIPADEARPISIEDYAFSNDESKLLIYTNSKRVWRTNARGDYWVLDLSTRQLKKLGDSVPPSTMMFATFSPNGKKIAYVHKNNIFVQDLLEFKVVQLTKDGSDTIINGTFDWVYEEELGLRNGFRWSPDSEKRREGISHHQQRQRPVSAADLDSLSQDWRKELRGTDRSEERLFPRQRNDLDRHSRRSARTLPREDGVGW
jgi:dipeptidyl-peptidase-4